MLASEASHPSGLGIDSGQGLVGFLCRHGGGLATSVEQLISVFPNCIAQSGNKFDCKEVEVEDA